MQIYISKQMKNLFNRNFKVSKKRQKLKKTPENENISFGHGLDWWN